MENGEVEGRGTNPVSGYKASKPHYLRDNLIFPLIQVGLKKEPELPNVPLLIEQDVRPEDKPLLEFMSLAVAVGRPLATSPGVPPERVAALRKAFHDTIRDPEFIAEAEKTNSEIRPVAGDVLAKQIDALISAPQNVKDRMKIVLEPKSSDTQEIKPEKK